MIHKQYKIFLHVSTGRVFSCVRRSFYWVTLNCSHGNGRCGMTVLVVLPQGLADIDMRVAEHNMIVV